MWASRGDPGPWACTDTPARSVSSLMQSALAILLVVFQLAVQSTQGLPVINRGHPALLTWQLVGARLLHQLVDLTHSPFSVRKSLLPHTHTWDSARGRHADILPCIPSLSLASRTRHPRLRTRSTCQSPALSPHPSASYATQRRAAWQPFPQPIEGVARNRLLTSTSAV